MDDVVHKVRSRTFYFLLGEEVIRDRLYGGVQFRRIAQYRGQFRENEALRGTVLGVCEPEFLQIVSLAAADIYDERAPHPSLLDGLYNGLRRVEACPAVQIETAVALHGLVKVGAELRIGTQHLPRACARAVGKLKAAVLGVRRVTVPDRCQVSRQFVVHLGLGVMESAIWTRQEGVRDKSLGPWRCAVSVAADFMEEMVRRDVPK